MRNAKRRLAIREGGDIPDPPPHLLVDDEVERGDLHIKQDILKHRRQRHVQDRRERDKDLRGALACQMVFRK